MSSVHKYTPEEIEFLKQISLGKYNSEITKLFNQEFNLNLSEKAIAGTRKRYKIKSGIDSKFKQKQSPWNKGTKGVHKGGEATQFKKGHRPHNYKPIGYERISKSGYIEIKIAEPSKWVSKHVIIWEERNGKVPKGHVVIFADTNKRNFDIDNLILVSRRQLLIMNGKQLIKKDADYTKVGANIAKLEEKINQKSKA